MRSLVQHFTLGLGLLLGTCAGNTFAAITIAIPSVADTTLSENYPSNNFGAMTFANAGTTQNFTKNRALFRFDIAGALPIQARIQSAALTLEVTRQPNAGYTLSDFSLYRVLRPWGEGNKLNASSGGSGQGSPATTNEATWYYRLAFTTNTWSAPGAAATNDYVPTASATQTIYDINNSPYTFGSSPQLVADTQLWLDQPAVNFGWILISQDEADNFTARGFGTRESGGFAPKLELIYLVPPQIISTGVTNGQFQLTFTALAGQSYDVQYRDSFSIGNWQPLAHFNMPATDTNLLAGDAVTNAQRFYRLLAN